MLNKKILSAFLCLFPLSLMSCNNSNVESDNETSSENSSISEDNSNNNNSISSDTNSNNSENSSEEDKFEDNPNYYYGLNNNDAFSKDLNFSVTSKNDDAILNLKIDNKIVNPLNEYDWDLKLYYETSNCNSDNANRAADYIYLNGVKLGKLPSNGSEGFNLNVLDNNLLIGENVITVTIGGYWGAPEYDYSGPNKANCDDYQIGNMHIISNTLEDINMHKMVEYKWVSGTRNTYNTYESVPEKDKLYWVGDGWSGAVACDGNDNERLNIAQKIDFYFNYDLPNSINSYSIDTTKYENGKHIVDLYDDDVKVLSREVFFDNDLPKFNCNIKENSLLDKNYTIDLDTYDNTTSVVNSKVLLDGILVEQEKISLENLENGKHSLSLYAKDQAKNYFYQAVEFELSSIGNYIQIDSKRNKNSIDFSIDNSNNSSIETTLYKVNNLEYNSNSKINQEEKFDANNPIQNFEVTVNDKSKDVYISYNGKSNSSQNQIVLSAFNEQTKKYDIIGKNYSGNTINAIISPSVYANENNKIVCKAEVEYVNNNSNKLLWASDTQYLPKKDFTDINNYYNQLMTYVSDEYKKGNSAYFVHTGDIVDENPFNPEVAADEWARATLAYEILDNNNVPYGVVAGNHDVGTDIYNLDYSFYLQYFSASRYNGKAFYGGTFNNNENHYDLVTIGNYDFIILYLGYGLVAYEDVVNWANTVLAKYPERNAIIATHAYLDAEGGHDLAVKADIMFDKIIATNENVRFAFSGHTDGSQYVKQTFNGREVYEILNCYQFVENDKYQISHIINGYKCNGEGYMKSIEFNENQITCKTFSPIKNINNDPYRQGSNEITLDINLIKANHTLTLKEFQACQIESKVSSIKQNQGNFENISNDNYMVLVNDTNNMIVFNIL